jgi:GNAT superfamily N-acetyltransferase
MSIRLATSEDLPAIHQLVRELAIFEKAEPEFTATLATYQRDFAAGWFNALVAEVQGEVVGMALFYPTYSTWKGRMIYLEDFVVRESFRRRGLGQQLFEGVLNYAQQQGCALLKWQVLDWNEPALAFYRKNKALIETEWWTGKILFSPEAI